MTRSKLVICKENSMHSKLCLYLVRLRQILGYSKGTLFHVLIVISTTPSPPSFSHHPTSLHPQSNLLQPRPLSLHHQSTLSQPPSTQYILWTLTVENISCWIFKGICYKHGLLNKLTYRQMTYLLSPVSVTRVSQLIC